MKSIYEMYKQNQLLHLCAHSHSEFPIETSANKRRSLNCKVEGRTLTQRRDCRFSSVTRSTLRARFHHFYLRTKLVPIRQWTTPSTETHYNYANNITYYLLYYLLYLRSKESHHKPDIDTVSTRNLYYFTHALHLHILSFLIPSIATFPHRFSITYSLLPKNFTLRLPEE